MHSVTNVMWMLNSQDLRIIGICIRDDLGRFVLEKIEWVSPMTNIDKGEALGLLYAI